MLIAIILSLIFGYHVDTSILQNFITPLLILLLLILVAIEYKKALSPQNLRLQVVTHRYILLDLFTGAVSCMSP